MNRSARQTLLGLVAASTLVAGLGISPALARGSSGQSADASVATQPGGASGVSAGLVFTATGDRAIAHELNGRTTYATVASQSGGVGDTLRTMQLGGHAYVVPMYAQAYLGRTLDLSLFDVTASSAAGGGRLAVQIAHTGARPQVPGITITSDAAGIAGGYLTPASARAFGAAVQHDFAARIANPTGSTLFAGVLRISATSAAPPVVHPDFPMKTLIIKGIDATGHRMEFGSGLFMNVDDGRKYVGFVGIENGEARISVPVGHYSGIFDSFSVGADGNFGIRAVPVAEYTVRSSDQTLTIDARQATAVPTISTPRPAPGGSSTFTYVRSDAKGFASISFSDGADAFTDYAVKPVPAARIGTQKFTVAYQLTGPGRTPAYTYDLYYSANKIAADQSRRVATSQLGVVRARYDADRPGQEAAFGRYAVDPTAFFFFIELFGLITPDQRTEYIYGQGDPAWAGIELGNVTKDDPAELDSSTRTHPAGTATTEVWRHGPLGAGIPTISSTEPFAFCYACRKNNLMTIAMAPFTDSTPDHVGQIYGSPNGSPVAHFTLTSGARTLFDQNDYLGAQLTVPAAPASYKAVLDVTRKWMGVTKSTTSHTELTFSSGQGSGPVGPGNWYCGGETLGGCRVLPVLQAKLAVPMSPISTVGVGASTFEVDAAQVQGAATSPVTGATLQLRPVGSGWTSYPLTVVGGSGGSRYGASVTLPSSLAGRAVDVRFGAQDASGATFSQTVTRAFTVVAGSSSASAPAATFGPTAAITAAASRTAPTVHRACAQAAAGQMACLAQWRAGTGHAGSARSLGSAKPNAAGAPARGYGPRDIAAAYQLDPTRGAGQTVAIVDAYDNPKVESDLAVYRKAWGLPACTTANGCFRKVNQRGGTKPPEGDAGWGVEIALDVQAVSAACPRCKILLVEADEPSFDALGAAENRAVALGAKIVSNSYGTDEFGSMNTVGQRYYKHPGVSIVASTGDYGFTAASFPAVWGNVIAVGGTTLNHHGSSWSERAWSGAGSGCSAYVAKPAWQVDTHCDMRTTADLSAVADPDTGLAVYDTYGLGPDNGWIVVGGTSLSAPLISGMIGVAGNASAVADPRYIYQHRAGLKDVVGGSNGFCGGDYLCTGKVGYDGPTGLGSPRGTGAL